MMMTILVVLIVSIVLSSVSDLAAGIADGLLSLISLVLWCLLIVGAALGIGAVVCGAVMMAI